MLASGKAGKALVFVGLLVLTGFAPLTTLPGGAAQPSGPVAGAARLDFDIPAGKPGGPVPAGGGPGVAGIPTFPTEDTLGFTTNAADMDLWKKDTDAAPISFDIDMGPLANKGQLYDDQGGYWLLLGFSLVGYFVVDNDGKFDSYLDPGHDGIGDEPCHAGRFDLFSIQVNGHDVWTAQGANERPCDTEGSRIFDLVPMTRGEPENQYRVPVSFVHQGKNTVTVTLKDTDFHHPSANKFSDGWWMYLRAAAMELVAPPLFISHGWNADKPPGGHQVGVSQWQQDLAANLHGKTLQFFGQDPWDWAKDIDTSGIAASAPGGCPSNGGSATPISGVTLWSRHGIFLWGFDGKQSFRSTGCELANAILGVGGTLGYCYSCHPSDDGQGYWYIGYSMGGLIGRWAIQREGMLPLLGKYVSVGTPHEGSKWADIYVFAIDKLVAPYRQLDGDRLRHFLGWNDWWKDGVQARVYEHNHRDWFPWPHWEGDGLLVDSRADFEIKRDGNPIVDGLNADVGSMTGKAFAVAGDGGNRVRDVGSLLPYVGLPISLLPDGDLIVSVDSATLGGAFANTVCFAVHIEGVPTVPMYMYNDDCVQPFFEFLMGYRDPGKVSGQAAGDAPPKVPMAEAASFEEELTPDDVTGQALVEEKVQVEGAPRAFFQAVWPDEGHLVELSAVSPGGQEFTADNASALGAVFDERSMQGLRRAVLAVDQPEAGAWTLRLRSTDETPSWGVGVDLRAATQSSAQLGLRAPPRVAPDEAALVTATLPGIDSPVITGLATPANVTLNFRDDGQEGDATAGDGVWTARLAPQGAEGTLRLDVTAKGTAQGVDAQRTARTALTIAPQVDLVVTDVVPDDLQPWWGATVHATAHVMNAGRGPATGVVVTWTDDSDARRAAPLRRDEEVGTLLPGETREVRVDWTPSPGTRTLRLSAYLDGVEERMDNNAATARVDVLPAPRTAASVQGTQRNGWYVEAPSVTLAPFDGSPPAYAATRYQLDGGAWQDAAGPFAVAADGVHALRFRSTDAAGHVEPVREAALRVDRTAPDVALLRPAGGDVEALDQSVASPVPLTMPVVAGPVDVQVASSDGASGVARLELRVDGVLVQAFPSPGAATTWSWDSTTASTGRHVLRATATDGAGWSRSVEQQVYVTASRAVQVDNDPHATVDRLMPPVS